MERVQMKEETDFRFGLVLNPELDVNDHPRYQL